MTLTPGARVGAYEVQSLIGAGGMGEVYRATDAKLGRAVALKVLPESFALDPDRLARFRREAQVLASLNHPGIAAIYGLEESDGTQALVMELVDGPTLADRIAHGPLPLDEAVPIARQIADALETAHDQGIVHRDLKPSNIKVRADGTAKVLDFGLAKALEPKGAPAASLHESPTITSPALVTGVGVLLGTVAYMSPEQAKGKTADKRSDIWAFGCVLYEMLTGRRAFEGDDVTDTIAAVVSKDPAWEALPPDVPAAVRRALKRCLAKERHRRLSDISDVRLELDEHEIDASDAPRRYGQRRTLIPLLAAVLLSLIAGGSLVWLAAVREPDGLPRHVLRLDLGLPPGQRFAVHREDADFAVSPDGSRIAFSAEADDGLRRLYVRTLADDRTVPLVGSQGARSAFFSPDSRWVGFFADAGQGGLGLKKAAIDGTVVVPLFERTGGSRGGNWTDDGAIVFADGAGNAGLKRVSDAGGEPEVLAVPNRDAGETAYGWPDALPGGRRVIFSIRMSDNRNRIAVRDLDTGLQRIIIEDGSHPRYVSTGHLIYGANNRLWTVPFDSAALAVAGSPTPLSDQPLIKPSGAVAFSVSRTGTLVYMSGTMPEAGRVLSWLDRAGREELIPAPVRAYFYPRISPDGGRVALDTRDQLSDIWIWDFARRVLTRFTDDPGPDSYPVWSRDGKRIAWGSSGALYSRPSDGSRPPDRLTPVSEETTDLQPYSITPDDAQLLLRADGIAVFSIAQRTSTQIVPRTERPLNAEFSPDGKWIAYESVENSRREVFVRPFPGADPVRWQVSAVGGAHPVWSRDGRELFYVEPTGALMSVPVRTQNRFEFDSAVTILKNFPGIQGITGRPYDVAPDGRFLIIKEASLSASRPNEVRLRVIVNWTEELKRLVLAN
jgi:serine/threonine-protein kinase